MDRIIESVPNFSEGRDKKVIDSIAAAIKTVEGVTLANIDIGYAANRTVMTFFGEPEKVCMAAFAATKKASELIDMSKHKGEHPRIGATDVLPLVPLKGVTTEECVDYARALAKKISDELLIPTYCYENAAYTSSRENLAACRAGEYEGIREKISNPLWYPDNWQGYFSDKIIKSGITVVGARDFLIAVNFNLNTKNKDIAQQIASDIRESGRNVYNKDGEKVNNIPGSLKKVKAIGWYIEEYQRAQVSVNITDINVAPLHKVYMETLTKARKRGVKVTGTEIIGMVPSGVLIDSGRYFAKDKNLSDDQYIDIAVDAMKLNELFPFDKGKKLLKIDLL